jgi:hypothetical protein
MLYLLHIRECTDRISRYTRGGKAASFPAI